MRRHSLFIQIGLLLFAILLQKCATAQDFGRKFDLTVGKGSAMTSTGLPSFFISFPASWFATENAAATVYFDESLTLLEDRRRLSAIVGISPMLQLRPIHTIPEFLVKAGVGVNVLSSREIGGRHLGGNILFSPTVSAGIELPWMNNFLGVYYMFRHLSNAGLCDDNDGINFQYIVFCVRVKNL